MSHNNTTTEPNTGTDPPDRIPIGHTPLSSRLAHCNTILDRVCGYVDSIYDTIAVIADAYDPKFVSRLYLPLLVVEELRAVTHELASIQVSLMAHRNEEYRRKGYRKGRAKR